MLPELKVKLNSAKAEHINFCGTPVLPHHSAYTLLFSNMYPYAYRIIYCMDTNIECMRNMEGKRANMKVTTIKNIRIQRPLGYSLLRCDNCAIRYI